MFDELRQEVWQANRALVASGLVTLTWGNVSGIDRREGLVVIKPSGIDYEAMVPADMVVVDLDGRWVEGALRPSSDTLAHLALYRAWPAIGGVVHTHSLHATAFAQARRPIPCFGTTHADHFFGEVPVTRLLRRDETESDYERNTGRVIVERFADLDPQAMPGALVAGHGPFAWGASAGEAVCNAVALEAVARMALLTLSLDPSAEPLPEYLLRKHHTRKHGPDAYYGQAPPRGEAESET